MNLHVNIDSSQKLLDGRKPYRSPNRSMTADKQTQPCASRLKVLADETRLSVVRQLFDGPKHVGTINQAIGIDQSLLSHHLRVLRDAGLVEAERDGKAVLYRLAEGVEVAGANEAVDLGCCQLSFDEE